MTFNPFLLKLHWGEPKNSTELRAWTGAIGSEVGGKPRPWGHRFTTHQISRWFGVSYRRNGFVGLCVFGPSADYSTTDPPKFGYGAALRPLPQETGGSDGN